MHPWQNPDIIIRCKWLTSPCLNNNIHQPRVLRKQTTPLQILCTIRTNIKSDLFTSNSPRKYINFWYCFNNNYFQNLIFHFPFYCICSPELCFLIYFDNHFNLTCCSLFFSGSRENILIYNAFFFKVAFLLCSK